ncbi:MAG: ribosome-associated translation inhibitor RaiA [Bacteroidales bacterium]|jgi:putative sigma-54 modulation protein|nr:ribosome-associated translation inhibitor RaiA [Bacteroidales bacterium]
MEINVKSLHFDADKKLVEFINNKVGKLSQVADNIIEVDVVLKLEKSDVNENKIAEISVNIPKITGIFAKRNAKTFEEAVDLSCEALKTQLKKEKGKQRE